MSNQPGTTNSEDRRQKIIEKLEELLQTVSNWSDEEDEDYEEVQKNIEETHKLVDEFKAEQPAIYIYMEGGMIQGVSATHCIGVNTYDKDCLKSDENYEKDNGTPEDWDKMIKEKEAANEIMGIY